MIDVGHIQSAGGQIPGADQHGKGLGRIREDAHLDAGAVRPVGLRGRVRAVGNETLTGEGADEEGQPQERVEAIRLAGGSADAGRRQAIAPQQAGQGVAGQFGRE